MDKENTEQKNLTPDSDEVRFDQHTLSLTTVLPVKLTTEDEIKSYLKRKLPPGFFEMAYWEIEGNFAYATFSPHLKHAFVDKRKKG